MWRNFVNCATLKVLFTLPIPSTPNRVPYHSIIPVLCKIVNWLWYAFAIFSLVKVVSVSPNAISRWFNKITLSKYSSTQTGMIFKCTERRQYVIWFIKNIVQTTRGGSLIELLGLDPWKKFGGYERQINNLNRK